MVDNNHTVPVLVMTRNEDKYLEECVSSLLNTEIPVKIVIVDNASSSPKQISILEKLSKLSEVHVISCKSNRWVINLDYAFSYLREACIEYDFFVLTDGDIVVASDPDWLVTLFREIRSNLWLGKLGASIDLENIREKKEMESIYNEEMKYYGDTIAPDIFLAPVDTTLAIYRKDIFIQRSLKFRPGHMSAIRPYYHVGRSRLVKAVHRGWEDYSSQSIPLDKVVAFSKLGAHIKWDYVNLPPLQMLKYRIISTIFRMYWGLRLLAEYMSYILRFRVIRQNVLYEKSKSRSE